MHDGRLGVSYICDRSADLTGAALEMRFCGDWYISDPTNVERIREVTIPVPGTLELRGAEL